MATVQEALDRLYSDEALKQKLMTDPKPVLKEFGLDIPQSVSVHVHENNNHVFNAVLPAKPESAVSLGSDPLSKIIERAWSDSSFKSKLLSDPTEAAAEMGVRLPASVEVKIWENTATEEHIVLPANPVEAELSEMELEAVSGGLSKAAQAGTGCDIAQAATSVLGFTAVGKGLSDASGAASKAATTIASGNSKC